MVQTKEAQWPVKVRGRVSGLCSGSDQLDLIFWLLLSSKPKVTAILRQLSGGKPSA